LNTETKRVGAAGYLAEIQGEKKAIHKGTTAWNPKERINGSRGVGKESGAEGQPMNAYPSNQKSASGGKKTKTMQSGKAEKHPSSIKKSKATKRKPVGAGANQI